MNKKLIHALLFAIAIFFVIPTMAQTTISPKLEKNFQKLFNKGIKRGRDPYGAYLSKKWFKDKEEENHFCNYLRQRGFYVLNTSPTRGISFIENTLIEDYVCKKYTSYPYEDFTKNCYYHQKKWKMEAYLWFDKVNIYGFDICSHKICWHGNVENENIEGKGIGFFRKGDAFYIMKNGEFHYGFPFSKVDITEIKFSRTSRYNWIDEHNYTLKMDDVKKDDILSSYGKNLDASTQKAVMAYYKEYLGGIAKENSSELDENHYNNIKNTIDVDYYIGAFPNGRHIQEVTQWKQNNYASFKVYQQETIDKAFDLIQTYLKEKVNGGSNLLNMESEKPSSDELSKIKNEKERLLKRASYFAEDIKNNLSNDKNAQDKVQRFYDYIDILNGFYAVNQSLDVNSCVGEDFWGQIISPNPKTTYSLTNKGLKIKSLFEKAGKTTLKRIDENHFAEHDLLQQTFDYIYNYYKSFIDAVNGQLAMENKQHVSEKLNSSSFKYYKLEDGDLVITLQNNDIYRFRLSEGKWKYSSGNTAKVFPTVTSYNSIEEAIADAEKMNREFWNRGK